MSDIDQLLDDKDDFIDHDEDQLDDILNESDEHEKPQTQTLQSEPKRRLSRCSYGSIKMDDLEKFLEFNPDDLYQEVVGSDFSDVMETQDANESDESPLRSPKTPIKESNVFLEKKDDPLDQIEKLERNVDPEYMALIEEEFGPKMILNLKNDPDRIKNLVMQHIKSVQVNAATCVSAHPYVCIGYQNAEIAVYKDQYEFAFTLKPVSLVTGSTVVLDQHENFLAAGYEKAVILWDSNSQAMLRSIIASSICIKFCGSKFFSADSLGSLVLHKIGRSIWSYYVESEDIYVKNPKPVYNIDSVKILSKMYAALCSEDLVIIMSVEPQVDIIQKIQKDSMINPFVCWGIKDQSPCLAIYWGKFIELYTFEEEKENTSVRLLKFVVHYIHESQIFSLKWASQDMLVLIDYEKHLATVYTGRFKSSNTPAEVEDQDYDYEEYRNAVQSQFLFDQKIISSKVKTSKRVDLTVCSGVSSAQNSFIIVADYCIKGRVLMWSEYIKILIDKTKGDDEIEVWYSILHLTLNIHRGKVKCFAQIDSTERMIQYLSQDIVLSFLDIHDKKLCYVEEWETAILAVIEFCIETKQSEFLFKGLQQILSRVEKFDLFILCLEPFILRDLITWIPNDVLQYLSTKYKELGKTETIKRLIMRLELDKIDMTVIYQICVDHQIFTPLMMICPKTTQDYITPLYKIYQQWIQLKSDRLLLTCLWFIRMTFRGMLFDEKIPEAEWKTSIKQIVQWILVDDVLKSFTENVTNVFFKVFSTIFYEPCKSIVQEIDQSFMRYLGKASNITPLEGIVEKMDESLKHIKNDEVQLKYSKFIARAIVYYKIKVRRQIQKESLDRLIDFVQANCQNMKKYERYISYILGLITDEDFEKSFQVKEVYAVMLQKKGQTKEAIETILNQEDANKQQRVFRFIKIYNISLQMYQQHIPKLCGLDFTETCHVLRDQDLSLINLPNNMIFKIYRKHLKWSYRIINQPHFLQLLIQIKPTEVVNEVSQQQYDLDMLHQIFLKNNHLEGLGYVLERWGQYSKSIDAYLEDFMNWLDSTIQHQSKLVQLIGKFENVFRAASLYSDINKDVWIELAEKLISENTLEKYWSRVNKKNQKLIVQLNQMFSSIYTQISLNSLDDLVKLIVNNKNFFELKWIRNSFKQVLLDFKIDWRIYKSSTKIYHRKKQDLELMVFEKQQQATMHEITCAECSLDIEITNQKDFVVLMSCGHIIHQSCLSLPFCQKCSQKIRMQIEAYIATNHEVNLVPDEMIRRHHPHEEVKQQREVEQLYEITPTDLKIFKEQQLLQNLSKLDEELEQYYY